MKTLNQIRENYDYGFISQREFVIKVVDVLCTCGLSMNADFLFRLDKVERAEKLIRAAYDDMMEVPEQMEGVLGAVYGPLVPELYDLIDKLD